MVVPKTLWECALCQEKNDPKATACTSCLAHKSTTLVSPAGLLDSSLPDQEKSKPVNPAFRPEKKGRRKPGMKQDSTVGQPEASAAERAISELPNPYAAKPAVTNHASPTKALDVSLDQIAPSDTLVSSTSSIDESLEEAATAAGATISSSSGDVSNETPQKDGSSVPNLTEAPVSSARKEFMALAAMPEGDDEESLMACPRSYIFENRLEKAKQLRQCGNSHFSAQKPERALVCYARAEHHAEFDEAQLFEFTDEHRKMINDVRFPLHLNQGLCLHKLAVAARSGSSEQRSAALEVARSAMTEAKKAKAKPRGEFDELGEFDGSSDEDESSGGDVATPAVASTTEAADLSSSVEAATENTLLDSEVASGSSSGGAVQSKSMQSKPPLAPSVESKVAARVLAEARAALALAPQGHFKSLSLVARAHLLNGNFIDAVETCNRISAECQGLTKADLQAVATVQRDAKRGVAADQAKEKATFGGFLAKLIDEEASNGIVSSTNNSSDSSSSSSSSSSVAAGAAIEKAAGPLFVPSASFHGVRPGYVFTTRNSTGTGYYRDESEIYSKEARTRDNEFDSTKSSSDSWLADNKSSGSLLRAWVLRWAPMGLVLLVALLVSPEFRGGLMITFASTAAALSGSGRSQGLPLEEPTRTSAAAPLAPPEPAEVPPPVTKRRWWKKPFERKQETKKSTEQPAVKNAAQGLAQKAGRKLADIKKGKWL